MESMHLTAQLVVDEQMRHSTAFSARPDAPVLPVDDRAVTSPGRALGRLADRILPRRRAPLRHAPA